ncbi:ABC transporter permease [Segetibacter sp.]|uniref:ABC transporter permease n=1 Tax=Segetibacter sp. TaxID=2231182 RepID=UPI0026238A0A|nr:ABC transporter permease [Segetibacter sp.]MCW3079620.1 transporter permease [Segetibacter sp.]
MTKYKGSSQEAEDSQWDVIIEPQAHLFDIKLRDIWHYRDLLLLFVKRDITAQYKQTVLGPLWHFIQPVFTTIVFVMIFGKIANIPTDGIEPVLFYMSGITIWNYFSACLNATSGTFVANAGIFGKVYFPRLVIPLSTVMSNMIKFGIQFLLLIIAISYFGIKNHDFYFGSSWLLIPLLVLMMAALGLGAGIIISSLTTKYRDFTVLIGFAVQLLMYATPVAYPLSYLSTKSFINVIRYNPLTPIVEGFRYALFHKGSLEPIHLMYSGGFIVIILFIGLLVFSKVERTFMDTV